MTMAYAIKHQVMDGLTGKLKIDENSMRYDKAMSWKLRGMLCPVGGAAFQ